MPRESNQTNPQMTLRYDFDIVDIFPSDVFSDARIAQALGDIGIDGNAAGNKKALFRDQATVDAILAGPPALRDYLEASGFGFTTYDSGAPAGRYPAKDGPMIVHVVERLSQNRSDFDFAASRSVEPLPGGFNFGHFELHLATIKPIDMSLVRKSALARDGELPRWLVMLISAAAVALGGYYYFFGIDL